MLHLCFVADATSIHVQRWLGYFVKVGSYRVTCLSDKEGQAGDGIETILLPNRTTLDLMQQPCHKQAVLHARSLAIKAYLQDNPPDILHAHFLYQRGWSAAATGFHPLVITVYGSDIYMQNLQNRHVFQRWRDHWQNRHALRKADWVTGMSQDLCEQATQLGAKQVTWVPLGIDVSTFSTQICSDRIQTFRQQLDLSVNAWVVLSPRQMTPLYQIELIVAGFAEFHTHYSDSYLVLKDTDTQDIERLKYREQIKQQVQALGITAAVRWVNGLPYHQLPLLYQSAQAMVMAPKTDGLPVSMLECMASGTPVLAPKHKGYQGFLQHQKTGWCFDQTTPHAIANALLTLRSNPGLANQWASNIKPFLNQHGDFNHVMKNVAQHYESLCRNKHITYGKHLSSRPLAMF